MEKILNKYWNWVLIIFGASLLLQLCSLMEIYFRNSNKLSWLFISGCFTFYTILVFLVLLFIRRSQNTKNKISRKIRKFVDIEIDIIDILTGGYGLVLIYCLFYSILIFYFYYFVDILQKTQIVCIILFASIIVIIGLIIFISLIVGILMIKIINLVEGSKEKRKLIHEI